MCATGELRIKANMDWVLKLQSGINRSQNLSEHMILCCWVAHFSDRSVNNLIKNTVKLGFYL